MNKYLLIMGLAHCFLMLGAPDEKQALLMEEPGLSENQPAVLEHVYKDLIAGIKTGDLKKVKKAIAEGVGADEKGAALLLACKCGRQDIALTLLALGADVNATDEQGHTPLLAALLRRNYVLSDKLLDHGAQVNVANIWDITPIHTAAFAGREDLVRKILDRGARIHVVNREKRTPLMAAGLAGHQAVIKLLIEYGAECNTGTDITGLTFFDHLKRQGLLEHINAFIKERERPHSLPESSRRWWHIITRKKASPPYIK